MKRYENYVKVWLTQAVTDYAATAYCIRQYLMWDLTSSKAKTTYVLLYTFIDLSYIFLLLPYCLVMWQCTYFNISGFYVPTYLLF